MSTPRSGASAPPDAATATFAEEAAYYLTLTPRQLPSRYLYDRLGSALFEAICRLPWYRVTAVEQRLLEVHGARIFGSAGDVTDVVELGPGSGDKLVTLMAAGARRDTAVHLIDVSAEALVAATRAIAALADHLVVTTHQATYETGLRSIATAGQPDGRTLVLFLGSNIGNFDRARADGLLAGIRGALHPGDALLLGTDLVKPESELRLAYDDPLGVTAAFNRNLLVRMNRELGADFNVEDFAHRAPWNPSASRMEMYLVSRRPQRVRIAAAGLDLRFGEGETIWTESSYKYHPQDVEPMCGRAGFRVTAQWVDERFALTLAHAI